MKSAPANTKTGPSGSPDTQPASVPALVTSECDSEGDALELHEPDTRAPYREVFLLLPGLNLDPVRLEAWRELLLDAGFPTVLVRLSGHRGCDDGEWPRVTPEHWAQDLHRATEAVAARWPGSAVSCFGYSLGGLLAVAWPLSGGVSWRRVICLCPALRPRFPWGVLLWLLKAPLPGWVPIPSGAPRRFRLHGSTSIAAFRALSAWMGRLPPPEELASRGGQPQLWLYAPGDELVSTRVLRRYAQRWGPAVRCEPVRLSARRRYPRHLVIDPETVGAQGWAEMKQTAIQWLRRTDRPATVDEEMAGAGS